MASTHFDLFGLPNETRRLVYVFSLAGQAYVSVGMKANSRKEVRTNSKSRLQSRYLRDTKRTITKETRHLGALLLVNHQIRDEVMPIFYDLITLKLLGKYVGNTQMETFVSETIDDVTFSSFPINRVRPGRYWPPFSSKLKHLALAGGYAGAMAEHMRRFPVLETITLHNYCMMNPDYNHQPGSGFLSVLETSKHLRWISLTEPEREQILKDPSVVSLWAKYVLSHAPEKGLRQLVRLTGAKFRGAKFKVLLLRHLFDDNPDQEGKWMACKYDIVEINSDWSVVRKDVELAGVSHIDEFEDREERDLVDIFDFHVRRNALTLSDEDLQSRKLGWKTEVSDDWETEAKDSDDDVNSGGDDDDDDGEEEIHAEYLDGWPTEDEDEEDEEFRPESPEDWSTEDEDEDEDEDGGFDSGDDDLDNAN